MTTDLATTPIFLVGPMGAGKTAVGKRLAAELKREFIDSDHEIEARTGVDIPFIFDKEGESGFRKRESAMIDELSQVPGIILATGGGAVIDPENRRHLGSRGVVVYLQTSVSQQLSRTKRGGGRPLLNTADPEAVLSELMAVREPLYREIADMEVPTDRRQVRAVATEIVERLEAMRAPGGE